MSHKEWFETWFDSPYYHILYEHRGEQEAENFMDMLLRYLGLTGNQSVLDVACGKGRHAIYLAGKGLQVTGIDLSWKNISHAQRYEQENLSFFLHDMRHPCYINYFDAVFNLFTSFGYFETRRDNSRVIESMSYALKKGGKVVIDFFNADKIEKDLIPQQYISRHGILFLIKRYVSDNTVVKKIYFQDGGREFTFEERVQALRLSDFESYLSNNHLKVAGIFGDYELNDFHEKTSDRMIIVGEKF